MVDMDDFGHRAIARQYQNRTMTSFSENADHRKIFLAEIDFRSWFKLCFSGITILLEKREEFFGRSHDAGVSGQDLVSGIQDHIKRKGHSVKAFDLQALVALIVIPSISVKLDQDEVFFEGF